MKKRKSKSVRSGDDSVEANVVLSKIPADEAFCFYTGIDQKTNQIALDLAEFQERLRDVPLNSINFHTERKDFGRWVRESLGDEYLADKIDALSLLQSGEKLRMSLIKMVKMRIKQLRVS